MDQERESCKLSFVSVVAKQSEGSEPLSLHILSSLFAIPQIRKKGWTLREVYVIFHSSLYGQDNVRFYYAPRFNKQRSLTHFSNRFSHRFVHFLRTVEYSFDYTSLKVNNFYCRFLYWQREPLNF